MSHQLCFYLVLIVTMSAAAPDADSSSTPYHDALSTLPPPSPYVSDSLPPTPPRTAINAPRWRWRLFASLIPSLSGAGRRSTSSRDVPSPTDVVPSPIRALSQLQHVRVRTLPSFETCYKFGDVLGCGGAGTIYVVRPCTGGMAAAKVMRHNQYAVNEIAFLDRIQGDDGVYRGLPRLFDVHCSKDRKALIMVMQRFQGKEIRKQFTCYDAHWIANIYTDANWIDLFQSKSALASFLLLDELSEPSYSQVIPVEIRTRYGQYAGAHADECDQIRAKIKTLFETYEERLMMALFKLTCIVNQIHSHGYVHLDLKPQNVLVDNDLNVMVIDFGCVLPMMSKERSAIQKEPVCTAFTPRWSAPEVKRRYGYGYSSDIYSLGNVAQQFLAPGLLHLAPRLKRFIDQSSATSPADRLSAEELLMDREIFGRERDHFRKLYSCHGDDNDVLPVAFEQIVAMNGNQNSRGTDLEIPETNCPNHPSLLSACLRSPIHE